MYSIVYVLVDDSSLKYLNQLMKSLYSLRLHNPKIEVNVLCDKRTGELLKNVKFYLLKTVNIVAKKIDKSFTPVEKSRYLKVTARKHIKGDFLYIDTDTVICTKLPKIKSSKSFGITYDYNRADSYKWIVPNHPTIKMSGLDLTGCKGYFNSGVIWAKDDKHAKRIYDKWYKTWSNTKKQGFYRDQPSINYVLINEFDHIKVLDPSWNVVMSTEITYSLNYLINAKIIHYFSEMGSPYKLAQAKYQAMSYDEPEIIEMLENPKTQFDNCRLVKLDEKNRLSTIQYGDLFSIRHRIKKDAKWSWNNTVKPFIADKIRATKDDDNAK